MLLTENPFYILRVSSTDPREKILEQADIRSLEIDPEICSQAKSILTHPRARLTAEIHWLSNISPQEAQEIVNSLNESPIALGEILKNLEPLSKCNVLAYAISINEYKDLDLWINFLCFTHSQIDKTHVFSLINGNRQLANLPQLNNIALIEEELNSHKNFLIKVIINALDKSEFPEKIMQNVLQNSISSAILTIPEIINDLVDAYYLEIKKYLERIFIEVRKYLQQISNHLNIGDKSQIDINIQKIKHLIKFWNEIIKPVQILYNAKNLIDEDSNSIFQQIRQQSIMLSNTFYLSKPAKELIELLQQVLNIYPKFSETLENDLNVLNEILRQEQYG